MVSELTWISLGGMFCLTALLITIYYIESKKPKSENGPLKDPLYRSLILFAVFVATIYIMIGQEILPPDFNKEYWWIYFVVLLLIIGINLTLFIWTRKKSFEQIKAAVLKFVQEELEDELIGPDKKGNYLITFKEQDINNSSIANFHVKSNKIKQYFVQIDTYSLRVVGYSNDFTAEDKKEMKKALIPKQIDEVTRRARTLLEGDESTENENREIE